jgi:hypothetical protein
MRHDLCKAVSEQNDEKPAEPKPRPAHLWKPGQSGNPKGRPRSGLAFAERVRERIDPDMIIDLAMRVAEDETLSVKTRLEALWPLIDRGFLKPPTTIAAQVHTTSSPTRDWSVVPIDERRELLARIRGAGRALALDDGTHRVADPKVIDGQAALSPTPVTPADEE